MAGGAGGSSNGTGGMLTKIKAATIATESGVFLFTFARPRKKMLFLEASEKTQDGSCFTAQTSFCVIRNNGWPSMPLAMGLYG